MSDELKEANEFADKLWQPTSTEIEAQKAYSMHLAGSANTCDFTRGFVCAIAVLLSSHGNGAEVKDLIACAGSTEKILSHADAEDITTLRSYGYL